MRRRDFDGAWKDVISGLPGEALRFFAGDLASRWEAAAGCEFLEQELASAPGEGLVVDKLLGLPLVGGGRALLHIELQDRREPGFGERLLRYFARIWLLYGEPLRSLAVLTDDTSWSPEKRVVVGAGREQLSFALETVKLRELEASGRLESENPFGLLSQAQLWAHRARSEAERRERRRELARRASARSWSGDCVLKVLRFFQRVMPLEGSGELELWLELKEEPMTFKSTIEILIREEVEKSIRAEAEQEIREQVEKSIRAETEREVTRRLVGELLRERYPERGGEVTERLERLEDAALRGLIPRLAAPMGWDQLWGDA